MPARLRRLVTRVPQPGVGHAFEPAAKAEEEFRALEARMAGEPAKGALDVLGSLGQAELDDALARLPEAATADQRRAAAQQLRMLQKRWEGTPAADHFAAAITRLEQP